MDGKKLLWEREMRVWAGGGFGYLRGRERGGAGRGGISDPSAAPTMMNEVEMFRWSRAAGDFHRRA